jgi:hypothetical protein
VGRTTKSPKLGRASLATKLQKKARLLATNNLVDCDRNRPNDVKKKKTNSELEDEMRPEYDLSKMRIVGRGIYRERYRSGTNLVMLEPDVRKAFPDDESVNEACA